MDSSGRIISKIIKNDNYFNNNSINDLKAIKNTETLTISAQELNVNTTLDMEGNEIINCSTINQLNTKVNTLQRQVAQLIGVINNLTGKNLN